LLDGDDGVEEGVVDRLGGVVGVVGSLGRVPGEAEGDVRSASVPPTRSLLSVHPASTPAPSARTQKPVSNLFISYLPRGFDPRGKAAMGVPPGHGLRYAEPWASGAVARTRRHTVKESSQ
jgi:hypothetical protein